MGRWRRYLRFSVRGLIVFVILVAAGLGSIVHEAHIQRDAVAAVRDAGGLVRYDWEWSHGKPVPGGKPWASKWLVDRIGVDYFGHVTRIWLAWSSTATDATLAHIGRLTRLQWLTVNSASVSDAGLVHLKGLTNLTVLELNFTQVSDAGLVHLEGLTNLAILSLDGTRLSDAGLVHLKGLTNLTDLWLDFPQVSDAGLAHLKGLTKLTSLALSQTQVTDAGANQLKLPVA
jgi:hypothetical protein